MEPLQRPQSSEPVRQRARTAAAQDRTLESRRFAAAWNEAGDSENGKCPASPTTVSSAPGMSCASTLLPAGGHTQSNAPTSTWVGTWMSARWGRTSYDGASSLKKYFATSPLNV